MRADKSQVLYWWLTQSSVDQCTGLLPQLFSFRFIIGQRWAVAFIAVCKVFPTDTFYLRAQSCVACRWCPLHPQISRPPLYHNLLNQIKPYFSLFKKIKKKNHESFEQKRKLACPNKPEILILVTWKQWRTENLHAQINLRPLDFILLTIKTRIPYCENCCQLELILACNEALMSSNNPGLYNAWMNYIDSYSCIPCLRNCNRNVFLIVSNHFLAILV